MLVCKRCAEDSVRDYRPAEPMINGSAKAVGLSEDVPQRGTARRGEPDSEEELMCADKFLCGLKELAPQHVARVQSATIHHLSEMTNDTVLVCSRLFGQ